MAAVLSDPGDLGARSVLADHWLTTDPPRGQFVALQVAALREGDDAEDAPARDAEAGRLLARHLETWLEPLRRFLGHGHSSMRTVPVVFRGGFPHKIQVTHHQLRRDWAAMRKVAPVQHVDVVDPQGRAGVRGHDASDGALPQV